MSDSAPSNGRAPGDRPDTGHPGAWSAATDPVGQRAAGALVDAEQVDREPVAGAPVSREPVSREPAGGEPGRPASPPARSRRPDSRRPDPSGGDLLTDLQRWLIRSSAKSMRREIEGQVRRTFGGGGRGQPEDVWGRATTEPPPVVGDSPECAWCPICRAARRMRESGPGLGSQISGASDVVATAVQDAIVALDTVLSRPPSAPGQPPRADRSPRSGPGSSAGDEAERARDEPGDRG